MDYLFAYVGVNWKEKCNAFSLSGKTVSPHESSTPWLISGTNGIHEMVFEMQSAGKVA